MLIWLMGKRGSENIERRYIKNHLEFMVGGVTNEIQLSENFCIGERDFNGDTKQV